MLVPINSARPLLHPRNSNFPPFFLSLHNQGKKKKINIKINTKEREWSVALFKRNLNKERAQHRLRNDDPGVSILNSWAAIDQSHRPMCNITWLVSFLSIHTDKLIHKSLTDFWDNITAFLFLLLNKHSNEINSKNKTTTKNAVEFLFSFRSRHCHDIFILQRKMKTDAHKQPTHSEKKRIENSPIFFC